jgi:hypothetical protein
VTLIYLVIFLLSTTLFGIWLETILVKNVCQINEIILEINRKNIWPTNNSKRNLKKNRPEPSRLRTPINHMKSNL